MTGALVRQECVPHGLAHGLVNGTALGYQEAPMTARRNFHAAAFLNSCHNDLSRSSVTEILSPTAILTAFPETELSYTTHESAKGWYESKKLRAPLR